MRIAISSSIRHNKTTLYDILPHTYIPFLSGVPGLDVVPVIVPNILPDPAVYVSALGAEAVVLTGGGDVDPAVYHEPNTHAIRMSSARDQTEFALLQWALDRDLPVVGICRGMQVINVFLGGSLVQDIPAQIGTAVVHDESEHPVRLSDTRLRRALESAVPGAIHGGRLTVNTFHHQAVSQERLAPGLDVFARSELDGVIEGVIHRQHPILGVQWHPERPNSPSLAADHALIAGAFRRAWW